MRKRRSSRQKTLLSPRDEHVVPPGSRPARSPEPFWLACDGLPRSANPRLELKRGAEATVAWPCSIQPIRYRNEIIRKKKGNSIQVYGRFPRPTLLDTMTTLFTVPITSTGGTIVCTNPTAKQGSETKEHIYLLTFTSPKDNRLTPTFIDAFILALDIIEHRYPRGVVVTTSGIPKFYSNGLDLELATSTEGFLDKWLWRLFRKFLT